MSKVVVSCDSFKDALGAEEVCDAIEAGLLAGNNSLEIVKLPLADGGEGTALALHRLLGGQIVTRQSFNPIMRPVNAHYVVSVDGTTAFIDLATCSGLQLLGQADRNPLTTNTFGTGLLLKDALSRGVQKIVLGIGGSATNDAGMGMARSLGYIFRDENGDELNGFGKDLLKVQSVERPSKLVLPEVEVLCDVQNPLYGENGAAMVYAAQKGASPKAIALLDAGLKNFAKVIEQQLGKHNADMPGAGAAGGMGYGAMTFLNARMRSGGEAITEYAKLAEEISNADLVITGEGSLDCQTVNGKLISEVAKVAKSANVPTIALCGRVSSDDREILKLGLYTAFEISQADMMLSEALARTAELLEKKSMDISKNLFPA